MSDPIQRGLEALRDFWAEYEGRQPLGLTPRERAERVMDAMREAELPPSKAERKRRKQQRRRAARVAADVHPLAATAILSDATRRIGGTAAAAVVHEGRVVASDVFEARSSNVAEMRGVALAARYAATAGMETAMFLCDNGGVVSCVQQRKYGIAMAGDVEWLRLLVDRPGWRLEHVPRKMVREAHRAAALALA